MNFDVNGCTDSPYTNITEIKSCLLKCIRSSSSC